MIQLTQHAKYRMQQRGITKTTLDYLYQFGSKISSSKGCVIYYFTKKARQKISCEFGDIVIRKIESQLDSYAVITRQGDVLTVGHRTKRFLRQ